MHNDRIDYAGDIAELIAKIAAAYRLGSVSGFSVIAVGYEDSNVRFVTAGGTYVAKLFAKTRTPEDIARYAGILQTVTTAGVRHPQILSALDGGILCRIGNVSLIVMRSIAGKTFYELGRAPDHDEAAEIVRQVAMLHAIEYQPSYIVDSWAIPHIDALAKRVRPYIDAADEPLVNEVLRRYHAIAAQQLPTALVHGDVIKTNVIKGDDGALYLIDFSVANQYPRIQELAVMAANLLHESGGAGLARRCTQLAEAYDRYAALTAVEHASLYDYALAGVAMEFLGALREQHIEGDDGPETAYWLTLGREQLHAELS
jgi:Ser/Thr protein kinase RdoA (MazF antagonist)